LGFVTNAIVKIQRFLFESVDASILAAL